MTRARRAEGGFTMLELLITLVITVFGLLGILALHKSLSQSATYAAQAQEAVSVGTQVIETLRNKRPNDLSVEVTGATASPPYANAAYTAVLGRNSVSYSVAVSVQAATAMLWRLRVEVSWTDDVTGDVRTIPVELLRTSQESL